MVPVAKSQRPPERGRAIASATIVGITLWRNIYSNPEPEVNEATLPPIAEIMRNKSHMAMGKISVFK